VTLIKKKKKGISIDAGLKVDAKGAKVEVKMGKGKGKSKSSSSSSSSSNKKKVVKKVEVKLNDCIPSDESKFDVSGDKKVELDALRLIPEMKVEVKSNANIEVKKPTEKKKVAHPLLVLVPQRKRKFLNP